MKNLASYILDNILEEKVDIEEEEIDGFVTVKVFAPQEAMGKVIGKGGKTVNAIKNLLKIKAIKENKKVDIQIEEK